MVRGSMALNFRTIVGGYNIWYTEIILWYPYSLACSFYWDTIGMLYATYMYIYIYIHTNDEGYNQKYDIIWCFGLSDTCGYHNFHGILKHE